MQQECINDIYNAISKENIFLNEPMKKHTSLKIGGPAEVFIKIKSIEELQSILAIVKKHNINLHTIGNGTNVLVKDEGIKGLVIKIEMNKISINKKEDYAEVTAESGATIATMAYKLMQNDITGFEELSGIPGTVGGAIRMNAGAHGKEMKDIVINTKCMDLEGNIHSFTNKEQKFEYRNSIFSKENYIILETKLKLRYGNKEKIKSAMEEYSAWRRQNQPLEYPNAGSTFKRGKGFITASLIDECGLKGYKIGGAQVSTKHAGFIINTGDATAKDVLDLTVYVEKEVYKKTGKKIELEIQIL